MTFVILLKRRKITLKELQRCLNYNPLTGIFTWIAKSSPSSHIKIGSKITHINKDGYVKIYLHNKAYMAHRLAWFYMTGEWPKEEIDHKNRKRFDNRWKNLREATHNQNQHNRIQCKRNTSGYKGVSYEKRLGKYRAQIDAHGKRYHIGLFSTAKEAHDAWCTKAEELHGEFFKT